VGGGVYCVSPRDFLGLSTAATATLCRTRVASTMRHMLPASFLPGAARR
jgi:hypothetical protein